MNRKGERERDVMRVGIVYWRENDELPSVVSNTVESLGHEAVALRSEGALPAGIDVVLALGPFGSLAPLAAQLLAQPAQRRPTFVLWQTEQFWSPRLPTFLGRIIGEVRSYADRFALREVEDRAWKKEPGRGWLTSRAFRFRYYGDLHWLRRQGLLTILAIPSKWVAEFLRAQGFATTLAYVGSHPSWKGEDDVERDVPALWIGRTVSNRRRRALRRLRAELKERGVELLVIDGVEHPPVYGAERTALLTRTKVVVNLLRKPWDCNALRYYLAAPARALIVTEPTLPHTPFVDGVHLVQVPLREMAETICYCLRNETARQEIAERAYELVINELTMANGVARILERVAQARREGSASCPAHS